MSEPTIKALLYRAIRELAYIQSIACEFVPKRNQDLIASAEGAEVVEQGMRALGVADLSKESLYE